MNDKYKIGLTDNAVPFAFTAARKVTVPLLPRFKAELDQMQLHAVCGM